MQGARLPASTSVLLAAERTSRSGWTAARCPPSALHSRTAQDLRTLGRPLTSSPALSVPQGGQGALGQAPGREAPGGREALCLILGLATVTCAWVTWGGRASSRLPHPVPDGALCNEVAKRSSRFRAGVGPLPEGSRPGPLRGSCWEVRRPRPLARSRPSLQPRWTPGVHAAPELSSWCSTRLRPCSGLGRRRRHGA